MKKQTVLTFDEVESCRFDLIAHTIQQMVGECFHDSNVTFKNSNEGLDLYFDMYKGNSLFALISVFRYDEHKQYLIDYKEVESLTEHIKIQ